MRHCFTVDDRPKKIDKQQMDFISTYLDAKKKGTFPIQFQGIAAALVSSG